MREFVADFETTTDKFDLRVWASATVEIGTENVVFTTNINDFMHNLIPNSTVYFHNLKFDGEFILNWLFENGYEHVTLESKRDKLKKNQFTTLISDTITWYTMRVFINGGEVTFIDSLKIIPLSVDKIAKAYGLKISKLKIKYDAYRSPTHKLTQWEKEYIKNDVLIVAKGLEIIHSHGLNKITAGSNAFEDFKKIVGKERFKQVFPKPEYDSDVRAAYKGGFTWVNPKFQGKVYGKGLVYDVNSLYPDVMYNRPLPYGEGIAFKGKYKKDKFYNLYIQMIRCDFKLKDGYIPTLQIKNNLDFVSNEYVTDSKGLSPVLVLTNVDLELFLDHYDIENGVESIEYMGGWKFKSTDTMFKTYIDKWYHEKEEAGKMGNAGKKSVAKLMLNSLYGKFGVNPKGSVSIPEMTENGVSYKNKEDREKDLIYLPVACFVTAWARYKTITTAQSLFDRIIYCDTDSVHIKGWEEPENMEIDDNKLGAWKLESKFTKCKFLRQKCYLEMIKGKINVKCAGMPSVCHSQVTFDNFKIGATYTGKLSPKHYKGGIILEGTTFKIKEKFSLTI